MGKTEIIFKVYYFSELWKGFKEIFFWDARILFEGINFHGITFFVDFSSNIMVASVGNRGEFGYWELKKGLYSVLKKVEGEEVIKPILQK